MCVCCIVYFGIQVEWDRIIIPVVLISKSEGDRLVSLMRLAAVNLDEHGRQLYVPEL